MDDDVEWVIEKADEKNLESNFDHNQFHQCKQSLHPELSSTRNECRYWVDLAIEKLNSFQNCTAVNILNDLVNYLISSRRL